MINTLFINKIKIIIYSKLIIYIINKKLYNKIRYYIRYMQYIKIIKLINFILNNIEKVRLFE